jgi:hypothetical protein
MSKRVALEDYKNRTSTVEFILEVDQATFFHEWSYHLRLVHEYQRPDPDDYVQFFCEAPSCRRGTICEQHNFCENMESDYCSCISDLEVSSSAELQFFWNQYDTSNIMHCEGCA